jgi:hypothetical protein
MMITRNLILTAVLLAASLSANASVLLNIDGQDYLGEYQLEYEVSAQVFHIAFFGSHACQGSTVSVPGSGLTLDIDGELFALSGSITLELDQNPARLLMATTAGDLVCEGDRIFRDSFTPI